MDQRKMAEAVRLFLEGLTEGAIVDELERTPERVARAWAEELASGYAVDPTGELTWIPAPSNAGPVVVRNISVASVCVHHLLPFFGFAHVAYLPEARQAGLSKLGRVVDAHARRLQTQEHLTRAIVETVDGVLEPRGAAVVVEAQHTCMTLRGVRKEQSTMLTVATCGVYDTDPEARRQVLALLSRRAAE
jgi:GTP cyclohydrolase I